MGPRRNCRMQSERDFHMPVHGEYAATTSLLQLSCVARAGLTPSRSKETGALVVTAATRSWPTPWKQPWHQWNTVSRGSNVETMTILWQSKTQQSTTNVENNNKMRNRLPWIVWCIISHGLYRYRIRHCPWWIVHRLYWALLAIDCTRIVHDCHWLIICNVRNNQLQKRKTSMRW